MSLYKNTYSIEKSISRSNLEAKLTGSRAGLLFFKKNSTTEFTYIMNNKKPLSCACRIAALMLFSSLLSACGGGGGSDTPTSNEEENKPIPQSINVHLENTELLYYGEKERISLILTNSDGSTENIDDSANWTVKPEGVARIDIEGGASYIAPLETGTATVTASYAGLSDSVSVTVSPYIHSIEAKQSAIVFPRNTAMPFLNWAQARVQGGPDFSIVEDIIYTSSDPNVLDFSGTPYSVIVAPERDPLKGHITPRSVGSTTVTLSYGGLEFAKSEVQVDNYYLLDSDEQKEYRGPALSGFGLASNESGDVAVLTGSGYGQFALDVRVFYAETNQLGDKFNVFKEFPLKALHSGVGKAFIGDVLTIFWITPTGAYIADINTDTREVSYFTLSESAEEEYVAPNYLFQSESGSLLACWLNTAVMATQCKNRIFDGTWSTETLELPRNIRTLNANHQGDAVLTRVLETPEGEKKLQAHRFSFENQPMVVTLEEVTVSPDAGSTARPDINSAGEIVVPVGYAPRRDELDIRESGLEMAVWNVTDGWSITEIYAYGKLQVGADIEVAWSKNRALLLLTNYLIGGTAAWLMENGEWNQTTSLGTIGYATPTLEYPIISTNGSWVLPVRAPRNLYLFCFNDSHDWSLLETFEATGQWGDIGSQYTTTPSMLLPLYWSEGAAFGQADGGLINNSLYFFHPEYSNLSSCSAGTAQ